MNTIKLDYGMEGLKVKLNPNWNYEILKPKSQKILNDPFDAIRNAIKNPLNSKSLFKLIKKKKTVNRVCIVISDSTRPTPSQIILKAILKELIEYGIPKEKILILIATGLHRATRKDEVKRMLGETIVEEYKIVNHIATDKASLSFLGYASNGVPIYINRNYVESDFKILTGYVEPHFFFGFSGGRKSLLPGISGEETIQGNHSAENIASQNARFGNLKENPLHINSVEILRKVGVDFTVNVCINENHEITKVAAGNAEKVHQFLVNYQLKNVFKVINEPFDIVICGNGGYPLDLNLYQAVKSMAIGEMAVKNRGTIISVNQLSEGIGHDNFKDLIFSSNTAETIYNEILDGTIKVSDQWEIQILCRILMKSDVYVISELNQEEIGNIGLKFALTVEDAIEESLKKYGEDAKILFLPVGPSLLPLLKTG